MSLHRWAARRDGNEAQITDALESLGVTVRKLQQKDLGDLLCWTRREGYRVLEVKRAKAKLKPGQATLAQQIPICLVRSVADALALYGVHDE